MAFLTGCYGGSLARMFRNDPGKLRRGLLPVNGIGPETADAIMLYAAGHPVFVADTYTRRILTRHGVMKEGDGYHVVQQLFMDSLRRDADRFNEYHAHLVKLGKMHCAKPRHGAAAALLNHYCRARSRFVSQASPKPKTKDKIWEPPVAPYNI